jgi:hypothetical protein
MAQAKTTLLLIVVLTILVLVALTAYLTRPYGHPGGVQLEIDVTPSGIPRSGTWSVTSSLFNWTTDTRVVVDSTINMTSTLDDGTKTVQTKNTSSGQASFSVPSNTVAVRFDATYKTYNASTTFSGHSVVSEGLASASAGVGVTVGFAYAVTAWFWYDGGKIDRWRCLVILPGLIVGVLSLAYLVPSYQTWYGTGWFPYSFFGFPVWGFSVAALVLGGVATYMGKTALGRKRQPLEPPQKPFDDQAWDPEQE